MPTTSVLAVRPMADSGLWGLVAALAGAVAGRLLTSGVGGLLDAGAFAYDGSPAAAVGHGQRTRRWMELAAVAAAVGLWWWEVRLLGLGPAAEGDVAAAGAAGSDALARSAAHAVLWLFLAAAAWIDMR
ncbi:MAG: hypothetical protein ACKOHG_12205, partial [Planctomycetia bacterium]